MLAEPDAIVGSGEEQRQQYSTIIPALPAKVLAIKLQNVERIQERLARAGAAEHGAHAIKLRYAVRTADHDLASSTSDVTGRARMTSTTAGRLLLQSWPPRE
jgi:hypothetical protein